MPLHFSVDVADCGTLQNGIGLNSRCRFYAPVSLSLKRAVAQLFCRILGISPIGNGSCSAWTSALAGHVVKEWRRAEHSPTLLNKAA